MLLLEENRHQSDGMRVQTFSKTLKSEVVCKQTFRSDDQSRSNALKSEIVCTQTCKSDHKPIEVLLRLLALLMLLLLLE